MTPIFDSAIYKEMVYLAEISVSGSDNLSVIIFAENITRASSKAEEMIKEDLEELSKTRQVFPNKRVVNIKTFPLWKII